MKRNKLFTAIAAVALLGSTGAALVQPNTPVAQAAKKSKKKTAKYAVVRIRRGAPAYKVTFKKNRVSKISRLKRKKKSQSYAGGSTYAFWSYKYKKTTYYYIGGTSMVKAKDVKRTSKKKVPTYTSLIKAGIAAYNKRAQDWQNKLNAAKPATYSAKVTTASNYYVVGNDNKLVQASNQLPVGTVLTVMYKINGLFQSSDGTTFPGYIAQTTDNKVIAISSKTVTLDNPSANVLDQDQFSSANKNMESIYEAAKKDLGIKDTNTDSNNQ